MKLRIITIIVLFGFYFHGTAYGNWEKISGSLYESQAHAIQIDPFNSQTIYLGVKGSLYKTTDGGERWKKILKLESITSAVRTIYLPPGMPQIMLVGSDEGLYRSTNHGRSWEKIFNRYEEAASRVLSIGFDLGRPQSLLAGTAQGLFYSSDAGATWIIAPSFRDHVIYQMECLGDHSGRFLLASDHGLYLSNESLTAWQRIYTVASTAENPSETASSEEEEIPLDHIQRLSFLLGHENTQRIILVHDRQVVLTEDSGKTWRVQATNFAPPLISLVQSSGQDQDKIFIPTEGGVYFYQIASGKIQNVSFGLADPRSKDMVYSPEADSLFIATERGVFKLAHPEITLFLNESLQNKDRKIQDVLAYFRYEPSIQMLQDVAMRYAEVHPEKIERWRKAAALQAWVPSLSIGYGYGLDETVELDRGGTNDPDRFILGPEEADSDWSVDVSWDFSELIWNPDQTSIDTRSKLMVQLRDDVLNQLTHLYYARRKLQITSLLRPYQDLERELERRLQIDKYTAGIDALTGGYLSRHLEPHVTIAEKSS